MSIVKEIVELHQGQVSVTSHIGQGTRVTMTFTDTTEPPPDTQK
jgi:signal transduction histidine kinase